MPDAARARVIGLERVGIHKLMPEAASRVVSIDTLPMAMAAQTEPFMRAAQTHPMYIY
jgi:hypothetical protein